MADNNNVQTVKLGKTTIFLSSDVDALNNALLAHHEAEQVGKDTQRKAKPYVGGALETGKHKGQRWGVVGATKTGLKNALGPVVQFMQKQNAFAEAGTFATWLDTEEDDNLLENIGGLDTIDVSRLDSGKGYALYMVKDSDGNLQILAAIESRKARTYLPKDHPLYPADTTKK
jgi:hypothetical protein